MKRPQWLTTGRVMTVAVLAVLIAVGYALSTGRLKSGIGADQTQTISEKTDKQGNILEKTKTTTFQDEKTLWDWLSLLGVPLSLALLAGWLQQLQQERANKQEKLEKEIAEANQREEALQTYFDRISTLLVEKNLLAIVAKLNETRNKLLLADQKLLADQELLDVSTHVIRARTLSILRRLENDGVRKTSVIQFLLESEVIRELKLNRNYSALKDKDDFLNHGMKLARV